MPESCLLAILSLVWDHSENVEYIKTLVAALVTWQCWHSRTPGCIQNEEKGGGNVEQVVCTAITSLSGTSKIFVTVPQTMPGRKSLRVSLT